MKSNEKSVSTKKGLATDIAKPETKNLQNTEFETDKMQGKGSEKNVKSPFYENFLAKLPNNYMLLDYKEIAEIINIPHQRLARIINGTDAKDITLEELESIANYFKINLFTKRELSEIAATKELAKDIPILINAPNLQGISRPKVTFSFRMSRQNKEKSSKGSICAEIWFNSVRSTAFSTKIYGLYENWNKSNRFLGTGYDVELKNEQLATIEYDIQIIFRELLLNKKLAITANLIQKVYLGKDNVTVMDVINQYFVKIQAMFKAKVIKKSRLTQLKTYLHHIIDFIIENKQTDLLIRHVRQSFNTDFYEFILLKGFCKGYIRKLFYTIKSLFQFAIEKEYISINPYNAPKIKVDEKTLTFLNINELQKLKMFRSDVMRLQRAADLFLFQSYTGLCYADMQSFKIDVDTQALESGAIWILKERQKTGTLTRVPLFPEAFAILKKYNGELPKVLNHKYNLEIKKVAKLAGIDKHLTTHIARKTAGFLWLNSGLLSYKEVSQMLGHKSVVVTEKHYAKVLTNTIENKIIDAKIYTFVLQNEFNQALGILAINEEKEKIVNNDKLLTA